MANGNSAINRLIAMDQSSPKRILVIGDVIQDVWIHGHYMTCQDECMRIVETERFRTPGGAAGAARQLENWCSRVSLNGGTVLPAIYKTRYVVDGKIMFRHDNDGVREPNGTIGRRDLTMTRLQNGNFDAVLISDYDKGFLTAKFIRQVIDYCNKRNIPVVADAKREPEVYQGALIKCNDDYIEKYKSVCSRSIVTHKCKPPTVGLFDQLTCYNKLPVKCVNHVGAGDCFAAHLTLGLAYGLSLEDAAVTAHSAGRVYVQHPHGRPPHPHEIREDMLCPTPTC